VLRNLARDPDRIMFPEALDRTLGQEWRELYKLPPPPEPEEMPGLLQFMKLPEARCGPDPEEIRREATKLQVEAWFHKRLQALFRGYVSEPLPIITSQGHDFSLFLAVANPSRKAVDLARKFADVVTKTHGSARPLSGVGRGAGRSDTAAP